MADFLKNPFFTVVVMTVNLLVRFVLMGLGFKIQ